MTQHDHDDNTTPPPIMLTGPARELWTRHYDRLKTAGILDPDQDQEGFILLCQLWARADVARQEADKNPARNRTYLETVKSWQSLARQFGLLPLERRRSGIDNTPTELDEYGL